MKEIFPGVFMSGKKLLTKNLVPGYKSHSEELIFEEGAEYRVWEPSHSKPAAAIFKGLRFFPIKKGIKILYLGIANGNTATFFSDIIGLEGIIYGVEISERAIQDLNPIAVKRKNVIPILANAKLPEKYSWVEKVDVLYQDVAADDQSEILIRNAKLFLKKSGYAIIAIKARSIDVTKKPEIIYRQETEKLKEHFKIIGKKRLDPFEKDHLFLVMRNSKRHTQKHMTKP